MEERNLPLLDAASTARTTVGAVDGLLALGEGRVCGMISLRNDTCRGKD